MENELSDPVSLALNNPKDDTWHSIIQAYQSTVEHGQKTLVEKAKSKYSLLLMERHIIDVLGI